jgi:SAM-dependent methyltransferase
VKYKKDFFDIITLNHVLEHTNNPNEVLSKIKEIINKKGILIIGVPNSKSLAYRLFGKNWYQLDIPRHIINYSDYNLKLLLNKNGFKIIRVRYNSRPSQFSVSLRYALNIKNKIVENVLGLMFLPLTWVVNLLRIGDQIEVWCVK